MIPSSSSISRKLLEIYNTIINSNALYPTLIAVIYLLMVAGLLGFDHTQLATDIKDNFALLRIKKMDTAQTMLSTLITGIISLMALSFSMVMVVLSQASNTISPKVIQGLVTEKEHQFVLGNQLGTIIYCLVLLLLLRQKELFIIPSFTILMSVLLGIWSMCLFVFFIHSISQSIQITNIVKNIHTHTLRSLAHMDDEPDEREDTTLPAFSLPPHEYITDKPGFLQQIQAKRIIKIASRNNLVIRMHSPITDYIPTGSPLFYATVAPEELSEEIKRSIYNSILFDPVENVRQNYYFGFTQLSEVAVKALSPGINDPGIACLCLRYLTDLFVVLYGRKERNIYRDKAGNVRLVVNRIGYGELLSRCITPIRQYGAKDISVARDLLWLLSVLGARDAPS